MTPEQFVYWLQGFFEISEVDLNKKNMSETLSIQQVQVIRDHLKSVFDKQTPDRTVIVEPTVEELLKNPPKYEEDYTPYLPQIERTDTPILKPPYTVTCSSNPFNKEYC